MGRPLAYAMRSMTDTHLAAAWSTSDAQLAVDDRAVAGRIRGAVLDELDRRYPRLIDDWCAIPLDRGQPRALADMLTARTGLPVERREFVIIRSAVWTVRRHTDPPPLPGGGRVLADLCGPLGRRAQVVEIPAVLPAGRLVMVQGPVCDRMDWREAVRGVSHLRF